ncbi:hypothetical protein LCGC14_0740980 [marine sediment metagenome]|uniref:Uncharacterized protein n=1 Tax=marine sediment metagenome TaxID=412755 RepID=A0A0F9TDV4_9ZZZZ
MNDNTTTKMFKQRRVKFLGEVVDTIFTSMPFFSAYTILSTTIILYEMTKEYIQNLLPWMNVLWFMLILGLLFLPVMLVVYKYIIPSVWHFRSTQMQHLEGKIDDLSKQIAELREQKDVREGR